MGYFVFKLRANFFIAHECHADALDAVRRLDSRSHYADSYDRHFSFVNTPRYQQASNLGQALQAWRWLPDYDEQDNIVTLGFLGEKSGDEDILFAALAPFVRDGSSIEMAGEDGSVWRWLFTGGTVHRQAGQIVFAPSTEITPR